MSERFLVAHALCAVAASLRTKLDRQNSLVLMNHDLCMKGNRLVRTAVLFIVCSKKTLLCRLQTASASELLKIKQQFNLNCVLFICCKCFLTWLQTVDSGSPFDTVICY